MDPPPTCWHVLSLARPLAGEKEFRGAPSGREVEYYWEAPLRRLLESALASLSAHPATSDQSNLSGAALWSPATWVFPATSRRLPPRKVVASWPRAT